MDGYLKLLKQEKNNRLTHIITQTNRYLRTLGQKIKEQKEENAKRTKGAEFISEKKTEEVKMEVETVTTPIVEDAIVNIDEPKEEKELVGHIEQEESEAFKKINRRGLISSLTEKFGNWIKSDVDDFNDVK